MPLVYFYVVDRGLIGFIAVTSCEVYILGIVQCERESFTMSSERHFSTVCRAIRIFQIDLEHFDRISELKNQNGVSMLYYLRIVDAVDWEFAW